MILKKESQQNAEQMGRAVSKWTAQIPEWFPNDWQSKRHLPLHISTSNMWSLCPAHQASHVVAPLRVRRCWEPAVIPYTACPERPNKKTERRASSAKWGHSFTTGSDTLSKRIGIDLNPILVDINPISVDIGAYIQDSCIEQCSTQTCAVDISGYIIMIHIWFMLQKKEAVFRSTVRCTFGKSMLADGDSQIQKPAKATVIGCYISSTSLVTLVIHHMSSIYLSYLSYLYLFIYFCLHFFVPVWFCTTLCACTKSTSVSWSIACIIYVWCHMAVIDEWTYETLGKSTVDRVMSKNVE